MRCLYLNYRLLEGDACEGMERVTAYYKVGQLRVFRETPWLKVSFYIRQY